MKGGNPEDHNLSVTCSIHEVLVLVAQERTVLAEFV